jgi:spermidine synthase
MPVTICFFLSGAAALILQVLWTRMLGHVFGATTLAIATTLTAFMGGLALGSHLGGKIAPRLKRPLLAFAVLESLVGLYGLLVPGLFSLLPGVQRLIGADLGTGVLGYSILRFVVVTLIVLIPTTAMGATLPFLAEGVVKAEHHMASKTGQLYAANTFGAVFGAFFAGFVFIPTLGITTTVYLAAVIDLFVAGVVVLLFKISGSDRLLTKVDAEESPDEILTRLEGVELVGIDERTQKLSLLVFALSGAAAMALEVLCSRTVGVVIGASTYSFTLILVTFLIGLALGATFMSRRIDRIADPVYVLAWVEVTVGVLALLGSMLVDTLPTWIHSTARAHDVTMNAVYFTNFLIAAAVTFPATVALGTVMPLVVRILTPNGAQHAGPIVGRAYAVNTVGGILGSFLAGFVIIPFIGVERGIAIAAGTSVTLGLVLALARRRGVTPIASVAVACFLLMIFGPKWNVQAWTSGLFRMHIARNIYADGWSPSGQLVYHKDGISTTVTVEKESDGVGVSLKVNGKVDASDIGDMPTQVLSGLLPILMHDAAERVLVIGYGSGVTPGAVLQAPVKKVFLAEIESAVYEASNLHFSHVNHEPAKDERFEAVIDDGRNFLLTRNEEFDVIISEPSNPWMSGAASLFTVDFFQIARRRLKDDGIFLQWLQLYELSPENIHALIRTFRSVFPEVLIFSPDPFSNDTLLLGSKNPIRVDHARLAKAFSDPRMKAELVRAEVFEPEDLLGLFLLGTNQIERFVGKGPLNTDDNAMIEYGAPRDLITYATKDARLPFVEGIDGKRLEITPEYFVGFDFQSGPALVHAADRLLRQGQLTDAEAFLERAKEKGADIGRVARLLELTTEADSQPVVVITDQTKGDERYARVVMTMTQKNDKDALMMFEREKDLEEVSLAHRFLYAYLCYRRERDLDAEYLMEKVIEDKAFSRANPATLYYAGRILFDRGKYSEGIKLIEEYISTETSSTSTSTIAH